MIRKRKEEENEIKSSEMDKDKEKEKEKEKVRGIEHPNAMKGSIESWRRRSRMQSLQRENMALQRSSQARDEDTVRDKFQSSKKPMTRIFSFTLLRHPIERIISEFYYIKPRPAWHMLVKQSPQVEEAVVKGDLEAYLRHPDNPRHNSQLAMFTQGTKITLSEEWLSRVKEEGARNQLNETTLAAMRREKMDAMREQIGMERLRNMTMVGVTEDLERFMKMFAWIFWGRSTKKTQQVS